jgi:HAD superfamily phosphoserine phosphatase-like hydrolase
VFDIDGTLSPEISWTELTRQLGASVDAHLKIFNQYRHQDITYEQSRVQLISLWRETGHAKRDNIVSIFKSFAIRPEAAPLIRRLTRDGFELCVITGSFDLYAQVVASKLGIKNYYGNTTMYFDSDGTITSYDYYGDQSTRKVEQFLEFCGNHNIDPHACYAVGDGEGDLGLFHVTNHGILLTSDKQSLALRTAAWKSVISLEHVADTIEP